MKYVFNNKPINTQLLYGILIALWLLCAKAYGEQLTLRNPYNIANHLESEHFAIFWGSGLTAGELQPFLDYFEQNWAFFIEQKQFKAPLTTKQFKENIYISGTGQPVMDHELGGIQGLDLEGHEHIVIHKDHIVDPKRFQSIIVHEFFHSIQNSYFIPKLTPRLWLGEATATWSAFFALPEQVEFLAVNAFTQYAFYPQYSLDVVKNEQPSYHELLGGHHYGSFLFFIHLSDVLDDPNVVIKLFNFVVDEINQRQDKQGITVLADFIEQEYGVQLSELFQQFVARNAVWDYPEKDAYLAAIAAHDNGTNNEHTAAVEQQLVSTWKTIAAKYLPHRWGSSYVKFVPQTADKIELSFDGNLHGSMQSTAEWQLTLVVEKQNDIQYLAVPLQDNKVHQFVLDAEEVNALWLASSVLNQTASYDEVFAYRYQFAAEGQSAEAITSEVEYVTEPPPPKLTDQVGHGGGAVNVVWILLLLFRLVGGKLAKQLSKT